MFREVIDNIPHTKIEVSSIHGHGLFAIREIPAGTTLCELDGQVVPWSTYKRQVPSVVPHEWNAMPNDCVLLRIIRTKYCYINHSRTPNCELRSFPPKLVTLRTIQADEELTLDYRKEPLPEFYLSGHGSTYL